MQKVIPTVDNRNADTAAKQAIKKITVQSLTHDQKMTIIKKASAMLTKKG